ncbi:MAG: sigma-70 family RNA polymerase sigma factor [Flavobacteriaceae bacterium]|nr:sigma-70 family RNA polymerase sigma factor [Flavobacteriaceae bacterium]
MQRFEDDNVLAQRIIAGDTEAFRTFFKKYHRPLLGFVITLAHDLDQAEDIVQMSFISLWKRRKNLQPLGFKQLLFTTAKNLYIDQYRGTVSRAKLYAELTYGALGEVDGDDVHLQRQVAKLRKLIETLPERCREILRMTKLEGLSQQETADYLGISVRTVEAQIRVAYQKIREGFDKDDPMVLFLLVRALREIEAAQTSLD